MKDEDLDFLRGLVPTLSAAYPPSPRIKTFGEWTVIRLHRAVSSHYLGIVQLVEAQLGLEAMILLRSLYWNAVRLGWLALKPTKLENRSLRLAYHSVKEELELEREAHRTFGGSPERFAIAELEGQLVDLKRQLEDIGVTKVKRLPDEKDMAIQLGQGSKRPLIDLLSQLAHGGERSRSAALGRWTDTEGEERVTLHMEADPKETLLVGLAGAAGLVEATRAKAALLGWDSAQALITTLRAAVSEYIDEVGARAEQT